MPHFEDLQTHAYAILQAVLSGCDPAALVRPHLSSIPPGPVHLIAAGKASRAMTAALGASLGERIRFGMCVSSQAELGRPKGFPASVGLMHADHPLPSQANIEAAEAVRFVAQEFGAAAAREGAAAGTLVALLSGGGSAHLTLPAEGMSLHDLRTVTSALLRAGATINQLNCVRKHLELLKGGRLGVLTSPGDVRVLVMSDVIGDPLDVIASGPFAADPTTFAQAISTLKSFDLFERFPRIAAVLERGRDGELPETPKPDDRSGTLARISHTIIGSNRHALAFASAAAEQLGFRVARRETGDGAVDPKGELVGGVGCCSPGGLFGPARSAGASLAKELLERRAKGERHFAVILGGETTVHVTGSGTGGRNQELALAAALELAGVPGVAVLTLGTDGIDGPTDAAGAMVTGETVPEATRLGLDPRGALENNDSYSLLSRLDPSAHTIHFKPGATGTNLCDVAVGLVYE